MKLQNKVAVITGAGSGLGRAMALRFAAEGARIVIAELNEAKAEEVLREVQKAGAEAFAVTTDVSSSESVADLFRAIDDRAWPVDVMVNNAGNAGQLTPVHLMTDEQWHGVVHVHLSGTFYCTREAVKRMLAQGAGGAVINIASVAGLRGLPGGSSYTAAKGAIIAFTKGVAQEYAAQGIRVNAIAPGWVETPILENLPDQIRPLMVANTPLGRIGHPEEIAAVALFLAGDESSYIIGQTISPNGGLYT
ncbi:MAG TPA: SDR family NAD(P)-dependent oxidoreductase [Blastocatellia bacterium]|nr:SDR family NAD(P)-dependent oxidoreductase [Blastocatellia bacterium]HMV84389.1 SDR family NAD(P)-dependent oxidoreductase [Blastocatellia bacterium]HMZ22997.1 SDR family NAD(P)-dependent oxidoreductase [Blastocatellia bacterium]HNG31068.1 SDR family NAD(P)-dependent oxidoreductase [Blastocatellia bacterium]